MRLPWQPRQQRPPSAWEEEHLAAHAETLALIHHINELYAPLVADYQASANADAASAQAGAAALAELAAKFFEGKLAACIHCGGIHLRRACPRVRRMAGSMPNDLTEVEYFRDWDQSCVTWPEELAALEPVAEKAPE